MPEKRGRGRPKKTPLDDLNGLSADPRYPQDNIKPDDAFDQDQLAVWSRLFASTPQGHFFPADREDMIAYCRTVVSIRRENEALAKEPTMFVNRRTNSMRPNARLALVRQLERHRFTLADRLQLVPKARVNGRPKALTNSTKKVDQKITDLMPMIYNSGKK